MVTLIRNHKTVIFSNWSTVKRGKWTKVIRVSCDDGAKRFAKDFADSPKGLLAANKFAKAWIEA